MTQAQQPDASAAAVETLQALGYTWRGGEQWAPPIDKAPDFNLLDVKNARIEELEEMLRKECQHSADEKLRADQMSQQHSTQAELNSEARNELAQARSRILELEACHTEELRAYELTVSNLRAKVEELEQGKCLLQIAEPAAQSEGEAFQALSELTNALRERHYGRMPAEVQAAYDKAWTIVFTGEKSAPAAPQAVQAAVPAVRGEVLVTVSGFTGSGKSAIAGEIEIMCRALGLQVEWPDGVTEKNMTHADWTTALELYNPRVRIIERNVPRNTASGADQ